MDTQEDVKKITIKKRPIIIVIGIIYILFMYSSYNYSSSQYLFVLINFIFTIWVFLNIFSKKEYNFSLNSIFFIFHLFFFCIAPYFQYMENVTLWGGNEYTNFDYIFVTLIAFLTLIFYYLVYIFSISHLRKRKNTDVNFKFKKPKVNPYILFAISFLSFFIYLASVDFDLIRLLIRGGEGIESTAESMSMSSYLILSKFIRPIPAAALLIFKIHQLKNKYINIGLWILFLLSNSPFGLARFAVAAFYIPILLLYFRGTQLKYHFSVIMIVSVLILFPFLNQFRYWGQSISLNFDYSIFLQGHFDSFQMFMRVITDNIITYGSQLLGVLLFFVPRSIWPNKPIGSGYFVAEESGLFFNNVSMNYFGEGFINFGFFGIILFALIIGYFNAFMDFKFWEKPVTYRFRILYFVLIGMEFITLRGQLMSFFPIAVGYVASVYLVYFLSVKRIETDESNNQIPEVFQQEISE